MYYILYIIYLYIVIKEKANFIFKMKIFRPLPLSIHNIYLYIYIFQVYNVLLHPYDCVVHQQAAVRLIVSCNSVISLSTVFYGFCIYCANYAQCSLWNIEEQRFFLLVLDARFTPYFMLKFRFNISALIIFSSFIITQ